MKLYISPRKAEETKYNSTEGNIRVQQSRKSIKLLPEHIIDQIKAGEVIERPAALVKELVENSVDAGSSQIDIHIIDNGIELISINDNGHGMNFDDLPFAFCRHATSKIESFEDIYKLNSYGFRGEALASMCSISRMSCATSPSDPNQKGGKIVIHGGKEVSHTPHSSPKSGTSIFVKDLFYNTPARLKFIKSKTSEKNALKRILNSFLLSNPQISFSIKWDDSEKSFYSPVAQEDLDKRIDQVYFKKKASEGYLYFEEEYEGHRVQGYVSKASSRGNAGKNHYLFINNRLFTDKQIHQSVIKIMDRFWPYGEVGHYCVKLTVPPNQVDVNVHPNKTLVKFFKPSVVFSLVSTGLKKVLTSLPKSETNQNSPHSHNTNQSLFPVSNDNQNIQTNLSHFDYQHNQSSSDFSHQQMSRVESSNDFFKPLTSRFSIINIEGHDQSFLVDVESLLRNYIQKQFKTNIHEDSLIPLLISEPFKIEDQGIDKYFPLLKEKGFDLERIEDDLIVLRTTPEYFTQFPINEIMSAVLSSFEKSGNLCSFTLTNTIIRSQILKSLVEYSGLVELLNQNIIKSLDNDTISSLFDSKSNKKNSFHGK